VVGGGQLAIPLPVSVQLKVTVTSLLCQPAALAAGVAVATICGGVLSRLMVVERLALLPVRSVAVPVMICAAPSVVSRVGAVQLAMPAPLSAQVNETVTSLLCQPLALGSGVDVVLMVGAALSRWMVIVALALLPLRSVALPLISWFAPSLLMSCGGVQVAIPESTSLQSNETVTSFSCQPLIAGGKLSAGVIDGGVLSRLTVREVTALLPARSMTLPETVCSAPSPVTGCAAGHCATPESASLQLNVTVTSLRFQPNRFATGSWAAVIWGALLSRLMVTEVEAVLPALSRASPLTT